MHTIPPIVDAQTLLLRRAAPPLWNDPSVTTEVTYGEQLTYTQLADRVIQDVREAGDAAVRQLAERAGQKLPTSLEIAPERVRDRARACRTDVLAAIDAAATRIRDFHEREPVGSWRYEHDGVTLGQEVRPVERVGIYVPGGEAPLISSLLMAALPARAAGVGEIVVCTPAAPDGRLDPGLADGLRACDVDRVFTIGGPAAIAALAQGTQTIPRVDLICGPGAGPTVATMARVAGLVGVVSLPGPTETLLLADEAADPELVAADLLAQAEHSAEAWPVVVTPSRELCERVQREVGRQLHGLARREVAATSLRRYGAIVIARDLAHGVEIANAFAPEHLCLLIDDPWRWVDRIRNAGGVFVGEAACEALGDYILGPSHVMPTGGSARWSSPVSVRDFLRMTTVVGATEGAAAALAALAVPLAEAEGLTAHAAALRRRLRDLPG